ncbi:hypothetical protein EDC02_2568 [Micromonospora sp. Llam0]|uniref:hypothetical protein n=1 Tax=Micromonospora sp. Llam0 TaxID=2485143 RepID=UPI000FAF8761|nr:hypothetical protein [Micromonospora sp. Llam0]ROO60655.1 hypothetical protein EDC02_2568 [Micromonospora sp. Llam0]
MTTDSWLLIYAMLSAYCLAGCLMEHFAVFSGWPAVARGEFRAVQTAQGHGSGVVYVLPKVLLTALLIVLLAVAPDGIPAWPLWASMAVLAVSWASAALIQIPIQLRIRRTAETREIERLRRTDWVRVLAMVAHVGFVIVVVTVA